MFFKKRMIGCHRFAILSPSRSPPSSLALRLSWRNSLNFYVQNIFIYTISNRFRFLLLRFAFRWSTARKKLDFRVFCFGFDRLRFGFRNGFESKEIYRPTVAIVRCDLEAMPVVFGPRN